MFREVIRLGRVWRYCYTVLVETMFRKSTANSSITTVTQTPAPPTPIPRHYTTTAPSSLDVFETDAGKIVIVLLVMLFLLLLFLATVIYFAFRTYRTLQRTLRKQEADVRKVKSRTTQTRLTGEDMDQYRGLNGIYMGTYQGRQLGINYMPSRWHKVHPDWSDPWATKYPSLDTQYIKKTD